MREEEEIQDQEEIQDHAIPSLSLSPAEVQAWLEWAGSKLLSLHVSRLRPASHRSFWPDYPDDIFTAYGYTDETLKPAIPSAGDISLMDEVLRLILLVPNVAQRRILGYRSLVSPIHGRHLMSWRRIAGLLHTNHETARNWHEKGLKKISVETWGRPIVAKLRNLENP